MTFFTRKCIRIMMPWLVWLGLSIVPYTERSWVQFLVRTHTWVADLIPRPGTYERQLIDVSDISVSLSFPLPFSLKINEHALGWGLKKKMYMANDKTSHKLEKDMQTAKKRFVTCFTQCWISRIYRTIA